MKELNINLNEREFKLLLKSIKDRESNLDRICSTSDDEDVIALSGNDLVELRMFLRDFEKKGVELFGESCLNISEELL